MLDEHISPFFYNELVIKNATDEKVRCKNEVCCFGKPRDDGAGIT